LSLDSTFGVRHRSLKYFHVDLLKLLISFVLYVLVSLYVVIVKDVGILLARGLGRGPSGFQVSFMCSESVVVLVVFI